MSTIINTTANRFAEDVLAESARRPVLLDCWAAWCGPCQQLKPVLHGLAERLDGRLRLALCNTEAEPALARQLAVSSIPDVRLFVDGQEVDGFRGFRPADAIEAFLLPYLPSPAETQIRAAAEALALDDLDAAEQATRAATKADPLSARAWALRCQVAIAANDPPSARASLSGLRRCPGSAPQVERLQTQVNMLEERFSLANVDHESVAGRYAQALAAIARQDWTKALTELLAIVEEDKGWEGGKARQRMVDVFKILGKGDPLAEEFRSKLALALY